MKKLKYLPPQLTCINFIPSTLIATSSIYVNQLGTDAEVLTEKRGHWNSSNWDETYE